jgi:hypothetical protein
MKFATVTEDWIKNQLKPIFIQYTLNKKIENEIE